MSLPVSEPRSREPGISPERSVRAIYRYTGAVVATAVAVALRMLIDPWVGDKVPFAIQYTAIAYTAWRGSVGPALVSLSLGALAAIYLFIPPRYSWDASAPDVQWSLAVYLFTGAVMTFLGTAHRRAERQARETQKRALEREAALERLLARMSDGFVIYDNDWRFIYANDQAVRMSHRTREDLIGKRVWDLFPENVNTEGHRQLLRCMRDQVPVQYEVFVPRLQRWIEVRAFPSLEGVSLFATDISERKHAEQAVLEGAARNRAILEAVIDGIITIDESGVIEAMNAAAERQFGYRADEVIGKDVAMLMPAPYGREHGGYLLNYLQTGQKKVIGIGREVRGLRRNGTTFPMDLSVSELSLGGRRLFIGLVHDITERKSHEEQRERLLANERAARSDAERASRMKDEFLATVSHELRTPLNAILGWAQLLRIPNQPPEEVRQGLETMERNARLQAQLIEDLLDMSRITSGRLKLDVQLTDLRDVADAAIKSVQLAADARQISLQREFAEVMPACNGDAVRLQQVVWNLLSNAIKFTPRGGSVRVVLNGSADEIVMSVIDTGTGIKPEFMAHIFERFRQGDGSTTRRHGGLGLGLAIARHLVELHGGSLSAHSDGEGKGATFAVRLPISPTVFSASIGFAPPVRLPGRPVPADPQVSLRGVKVLVVDDEPDTRDVLVRVLGQHDAHVRAAASAAEAMTHIQAESPDVLISDIGMPEEDGYAFLQRLRSLPASQGGAIPALALTAFARAEDRTRAILCGYQAHLTKPVESMELIANVAALAGKVTTKSGLPLTSPPT